MMVVSQILKFDIDCVGGSCVCESVSGGSSEAEDTRPKAVWRGVLQQNQPSQESCQPAFSFTPSLSRLIPHRDGLLQAHCGCCLQSIR